MAEISPSHVLWRIAQSLSEEARSSVIVVGSLAAGYHFFGDTPEGQLRTKGADCMISTEKAVVVATNIVEQLFEDNWQLRTEGSHGKPGTAETKETDLPVVRVFPPNEKEWFLELLSSPVGSLQGDNREFQRLITSRGHFALCAFGRFALLEYQPITTQFGIKLANPEMMSLCNLLHHPEIGEATMSEKFDGRTVKRANKDIGRVIALALLTDQRDPDALLDWADHWRDALIEKFPAEATELMARAGSGLRALLASEKDFEESYFVAKAGLLSSQRQIGIEEYRAAGERLIADVIKRIEYLSTVPVPK